MKNKFKKSFRIKLLSSLFGLGVLASVSAVAASCASPDSKVVNNLFSSSDSNQFSNSPNGSIKNVVANGFLQKDGYQTLLKTKIAEILGIWYAKNQDPNVKSKYQKFVNDANDDWNKKVKDFQNQYGNNSEVYLQTNLLDSVGGTKDSWIQNEINQKVLDDFTNQVFKKSFLNYTDPTTGQIIYSPSQEDINNNLNWKNLKFTAGGFSKDNPLQNNNQTFAELQNFIFNQWVEIENPNLVSQVVFSNEEPKNGLKQIFNQNAVGSDNLNPSYEFQAFKDNLNPPTAAKGMNAYKEISSKTGLSKYLNANDTIDFPNILSSDSNGKILMTASDMFNSYDVAFSSAFVFQYLRMLGLEGTDKATIENQTIDKISNIKVQPNSSSIDSDYNIISNFINVKNTELDYPQEYTVPNPQYNNIEVNNLSSFNEIYKNLVSPPPGTTYNIYNLAKPAYESATTPKTTIPFNQFIFARAKDGVHIIAIDGGNYYLNQSTDEPHQRVIEKQEEFLKFRAYLISLPNGVSPGYSYTFDLNSQLKNWFNAHQVSLIYQFLSSQSKNDSSGASIFTDNPDLKTAFDNFQGEFGNYINAFILYNQVLNLQNDIDTMRSKLNAWAQTYSDYLKNNTPEKIGIAAKLPYVREADGDYFGLLQYYLEILNHIDSTTKTPVPPLTTPDPSSVIIDFNDNSIRGKTRQLIIDEVNSKYQDLVNATNNLVDSLDLQASDRIEYSQNLFIKSNKDSSLYLALNLVINATLTSDPVTSSLKMDYLTNSGDFKQIIGADNKLNDTPVIDDKGDKLSTGYLSQAIKNFYQQSAWNGLSDKTIYGNFVNQDQLNDKIDSAWKNQLGVSTYSSNKLNYSLLLYTIYYLLKDNLSNFKAILASQIYQGVDALVSWTVPTSPDATTNPITNFEANPNYIQGAGWNKQTSTATPATNTWNNTWFNTSVPSTSSDSMTPDPFNDSSNFYKYTAPTKTLKLYGFNGISTTNNTSNLDSNVADALFTNYALSGSYGSLYSFGSKTDLLDYIDRINNKKELDNLAKRLVQSGVELANYYQQDANAKDIHTFAEKKKIVEDAVAARPDDKGYFNAFTGFIGNSKAPVSITDTEAAFLSAYQKSKPVNESGDNKLTVIATLIKQINYKDVSNLGTGSWWSDADSSGGAGRLGLDLSSFLALIVQQAQDPATQSQAISYLIKNNNINDKNGSRIIIVDKRLYDALGNQWSTK